MKRKMQKSDVKMDLRESWPVHVDNDWESGKDEV